MKRKVCVVPNLAGIVLYTSGIVTVRIMEEDRNGEHIIRVDGWFEGEEEAAELLRVAREASCPVVVDLKYLQSSDSCGINALRTLHRNGAQLCHATGFIMLLLGLDDGPVTESSQSTTGGIP